MESEKFDELADNILQLLEICCRYVFAKVHSIEYLQLVI